MKDYAIMSDFEINAAVFEALHGGAPDYKEGDGGAMILISYEGDVVGGDAVEMEVERGFFNPCNNPADAWPIITENRISIIHLDDNEWGCRGDGDKSTCRAIDSNALRCAMIVFLMMKEGE